MTESLLTSRTTLKRLPERGMHDRETINRILDEGFLCHVGFVSDGQPFVIPTGYGRIGDDLYIHGSAASRMLRNLQKGIRVCVTVTLLDGLVLARSAFHHSMNYRSVVVLGTATLVEDREEKLSALRAISENIISPSLGRGSATDRSGIKGHQCPEAADYRGFRENPHWRPEG